MTAPDPIQRAAMAAAEECYGHFRVDVDMDCGIDEEKARAAAIIARHFARFEGVAHWADVALALYGPEESDCSCGDCAWCKLRAALKLLREEG